VSGCNSNDTRLREVLGGEPSIRLEQELAVTFDWIAAQVLSKPPVSLPFESPGFFHRGIEEEYCNYGLSVVIVLRTNYHFASF
jgi:hypothetical protein